MEYKTKYTIITDLSIKGLTLLLAIFVFINGWEALENQYKSKYWDYQLKTYSELLKTTGLLSSEDVTTQKFYTARKAFYSIFYGEANLVVSKKIAIKMIEIKKKLDLVNLKQNLKVNKAYQKEIANLSVELSRLCRESALTSWNIKMEKLNN